MKKIEPLYQSEFDHEGISIVLYALLTKINEIIERLNDEKD